MTQAVRRLALPVITLAIFVPAGGGCSKSAIKGAIQKAGAQMLQNTSDESLQKMFEQANKQCPRRMDAFTTLEEIVMVDSNRVEYRYQVNEAGKQLASRLDRGTLKEAFVKNMKGNPMAVAIAERNLAIDHIYNDQAGNHVLSYTIDRSVLQGNQAVAGAMNTNPYDANATRSRVDAAFYADGDETASAPPSSGSSPTVPGMRTNPFFNGQ